MFNRATLTVVALSALLVGCGEPAGDTGGNAAATATTPQPVSTGVDMGYVKQALAETAFDYGQCRRRPDLRNGASAGVEGEVLVLLDSSGSMAARASGGTRMDEARGAVTTFLASLPAGTRGGLAVNTGRLSGANPFGDSKFVDRNWSILEVVRNVAEELDRPVAEVALAWTLARRGVASTLTGASNVAQLNGNILAADLVLDGEHIRRLDEVSARRQDSVPR